MLNPAFLRFFTSSIITIGICFSAKAGVEISSNRVCKGDTSLLVNISTVVKQQLAEWDLDNDGFFDDATGDTIKHLFTRADIFNIRLKITDSTGREFFSLVAHPVIVDPVATISFKVDGKCLGLPTQFTGTATITDGSTLTYEWDFDNNNITDATTKNASHQYLSVDINPVKFTVNSTNGCKATFTKNAPVYTPPTAGFTLQNSCVNSPVTFRNQSSFGSSKIKQAVWNLDDGELSFAQDSIIHAYSYSGTFSVMLKVVDTSGCADSLVQDIVVLDRVNYAYTLSNTNSIYPGQTTVAEVTGAFSNILWDDSTATATRTISDSGYYSFTVINDVGCSAVDGFGVQLLQHLLHIEKANDFITPNGDGINDLLAFKNVEAFKACKLKVYDARGLEVYISEEYKNEWDGKNANAGVYYYAIKCEGIDELKGITNIVK